jgi:putative glycosyltransferase (TIGR04348 family)
MRIGIITPAPPRSQYGNRVTALRWAGILKGLGHRVSTLQEYRNEGFDSLVALHARRSHLSITRFHREYPDKPIIVALTGTDLYRDLPKSNQTRQSLELATRIIVLQPKARNELDPQMQPKARIIYQSAQMTRQRRVDQPLFSRSPEVCVVGHLRNVKDPFRAAMACRLLPGSSRIRVIQVGRAMTKFMAARARKETKINPRYLWLGELPHWRVRRVLSRSAACIVSSKMEGGANILSEAVVAGVPLLASHIPGNVGILGDGYAGYFKVGDTRGLARLLTRIENDPEFLKLLREQCASLAHLFEPSREKAAWVNLLSELFQRKQAGRVD